jgi:hypothetical protein
MSSNKKTCIINQFAGLGDIIFIMPLVRRRIRDGYRIVWPVNPVYLNIGKHFPEVEFVDKTKYVINYNEKRVVENDGKIIIPFRWADQIMGVPYSRCMESKYLMKGVPLSVWRESSWIRDYNNEERLFNKLGLIDGERYALVNDVYTTGATAKVLIPRVEGIKVVTMKTIPGYTLFDWGKVIQNAAIIHTVGTSINYVMELIDLKTEQIHLYPRIPQEKDFDNYEYLLTKDYIFHL